MAVNADGKFSHSTNWGNAGTVQKLAHVDHTNVLQILNTVAINLFLSPFQVLGALDELGQFLEDFLGWGLD